MQSTQNMEPKKHKSGILGRSIIQLKFADDSKIVVCRELNKSRSHLNSGLLCFFLSFQYCDASLHWHFRLLSVWWISFALIGQHDPQCHSQVKQYNAIIFGWKHTQAMCIAFVSFCVECDKFGATVNWRMFLHIYVYKSSRRIRVCVWEYDRRCRYGPTHHHTSGLPVAGVRLPVSVSRTCLKFKVSHRDFDNTQRRTYTSRSQTGCCIHHPKHAYMHSAQTTTTAAASNFEYGAHISIPYNNITCVIYIFI